MLRLLCAFALTMTPGRSNGLRAEWNRGDIVCRDGTIEITINGVRQNTITRCTPAAGRIGFQLEGTPFELRNVRLAPLQ